jgi:hypothetical protein
MKAHASPRIRRIATGFLLLACAAQVHALGRRENPAVTPLRNLTIKADPASPQKVEYSIGAAAGLGFMIFTVGWKPTTIQWVVAQDEGGIIGSPVGAGVLDALGADVSEYVLHPGSAVPPIGDATVAFGRIRDFPGDPLHRATGVSCRIPIGLDGAERHIRVLLVHQDGSWERIRFMASFEFFPGEAQLFGTRGDLPYHKKALAFLDTFFSDGTNEQTAFRNTAVLRLSGRYPDLKGDDAFWNAFRDMPGLDERRNMFRSVFLRHMEPVKGGLTDGSGGTSLSRPAWDSLRWDMLYGGEGSPYVTAYLGFLAEIGKPLFSKVLDSELRRVHTGHAYDWRQYQPLGVEEGPELARVALRYLHWGVEYTLASGRGGSEAVYKENREPFIDNWVLGGILANTRMSNYLPSGTAPVAVKPDAGDAGMLEQAVVAKDPLMLSSPFAGGKGNPIPYAEAGIDSPRTFAYKMAEQVKAREWYRLNARIADRTPESSMTTAAPEGFPGDEYVDERRLLVRLGRSVSMDREGWSYAAYQPRPLPVAGNGAILGPYGSATDVLKPFLPGTGAM